MLLKKIIGLLSLVACSSAFAGTLDKPLPICTNLSDRIVYEIVDSVYNACSLQHVEIPPSIIVGGFADSIYADSEYSAANCRRICLIMEATDGKAMDKCIDVIARGFRSGFDKSFSIHLMNQKNCHILKDKLSSIK